MASLTPMPTELEPLHLPHDGVTSQATNRGLLTEEEICELLRVSREAILKFKRDPIDPIPCFKAGRRFLYDQNQVLRWAKRHADRALRSFRKVP